MESSSIARPPAIHCIGKNYLDHVKETGLDKPLDYPLIFYKNPASLSKNGDDIVIPKICKVNGPQVDYEGELAIIIGKDCKNVSKEDALSVIGSYAVANDVSARWWQRKGSGGQFNFGKSFDTFCPMTVPVPASQVPDPQNLRITTKLNGTLMQESNTKMMIYDIPYLINHLSQGTTLLAGTIILTGTPGGVGDARVPPIYLKDGDVVEIEVENVGVLTNKVVEEQ